MDTVSDRRVGGGAGLRYYMQYVNANMQYVNVFVELLAVVVQPVSGTLLH